MKRTALILASLALVLLAFFFNRQERDERSALAEYGVWKEARLVEMRGEETTWLNLAGLFWLPEGVSTFGADASNDLVLREGDAPARIGLFAREGDTVFFEAAAGVPVQTADGPVTERLRLKDDEGIEAQATTLILGRLRWWIILRDGMLGVRVRDTESPAWKAFTGIETFAFDPKWRIEAEFVPFEEPRTFEYPTILGTTRNEESPGMLVFRHKGRQYEMIPFERDEGTRFFLVFGDQTNGDETYAGGRFVYTDLPDARGRTVLDFNKTYNPPCAFSAYTTCPQPLRQNRLPFPVTAGERNYAE